MMFFYTGYNYDGHFLVLFFEGNDGKKYKCKTNYSIIDTINLISSIKKYNEIQSTNLKLLYLSFIFFNWGLNFQL